MAPGFNSNYDGFEDEPDQNREVIEEDELNMIRQLKDLKKDYRDLFVALRDIKSAINYSQQVIDNSKQKLVSEFEVWYDETFEEAQKEDTIAQTSPAKMNKVSVSDRKLISFRCKPNLIKS